MNEIDKLENTYYSEYDKNIYSKRYWKIVKTLYDRNLEYDIKERHHILPRSLFPEMINDKSNIVTLKAKEHYIIHYILAKATNNPKMWFAFNMMRRVIKDDNKTCHLYEKSKKIIFRLIGENNKNTIFTDEFREEVSKRFKDKVVVKDEENNTMLVSVYDERYLSGKLVYYRTGYKHNQETKDKIKINGTRGKKFYYNPEEPKDCGFFLEGEEPINWINELHVDFKNKIADSISELVWCYNKNTNEQKRFKQGKIPDGWVKGRLSGSKEGLDKMNSMYNVVDLKNRKVTRVNEIKDYHGPETGHSTNKSFVYVFDNKIFTNYKVFEKYCYSIGYYITREFIKGEKKLPTRSKYKDRDSFYKKMREKSLEELGISIYKLTDFVYNDHLNKEIVWKI